MFFVKSSENVPGCPCCGGQLRYRDSRLRIRKHEGGDRDFLSIRRFRCTACESYHNELPDVLLPYKHYEAEVIRGVIDGIVTPNDQDSEDYPSVSTMLYWLRWFQLNLSNMEGYLRNAGYSILGLAGKGCSHHLQQRWFSAGLLLIHACTYFCSSVTGFSYIVISKGGHEL